MCAREVLFDLPLGLDHKSEVDAIAGNAGAQADRERPRIPQRIGKARARAEFVEALAASMRDDLPPRARPPRSDAGASGSRADDRLRLIKRLRADLAGVIDAHQARRVICAPSGESAASGTRWRDSGALARTVPASVRKCAVESEDEIIRSERSCSLHPSGEQCTHVDVRPRGLGARRDSCTAIRRSTIAYLPKKNGRPEDARMITSKSAICGD